MTAFRLSRRAALLGTAGIAIALPWLETMAPERTSRAAATPARRFLAVYTPGGTVPEAWTPMDSELSLNLSPILAPLEPVKKSLLVLGGIDMISAVGEQNESGMVAWLTGAAQGFGGGYSKTPSIDQVLAPRLSTGKKLSSLELAIRWGTGRALGKVSAKNIVNYSDTMPVSPIAPRIDPQATWTTLFGGLPPQMNTNGSWDKSILDAVDKRYVKLSQRLGGADKKRLDAHLTLLRELEKAVATTSSTCATPGLIDTSDYDPTSPGRPNSTYYTKDPTTDASIPKVGKLMMDMMVMAMACDMTSVGTLMWSDSEAGFTLPWLNLNETQKFYEGDGGYHPTELTLAFTWYANQHAYLLDRMAKVDLGTHSLLDESVVFFGSQVGWSPDHSKKNMPFLLAGGGGGLRGGRYLTYEHRSHNDLLTSIFNLFGDTRTTFGDPMYCTSPIANLT